MYLKALEIQGFKSFPDKTVLQFGEDITAIVGPNGSGKSNLSDAILWVMGEQSAKGLRGSKMEDVIFGGTAKRPQVGFAQVTLVLDNTTRIFPSMEEVEVAVTRRYYRSGESEYYINRQSVRLKDVTELFRDTGMGREGYSIIGQGKIDSILSVKSGERREIFEEAAGISKFRHRKEEAERKLARAQENLLRINDKIAELELQVEPLRDQAQRAKKYLILRDELRLLEISVWMEELDQKKMELRKIEMELRQAQQERDAAQAALDDLYVQSEQYGHRIQEKDLAAEELRRRIEAMDAGVRAQESEAALLESGIAHHEENVSRIQAELEETDNRSGGLTEQALEQQARIEVLEEEIAEDRRSLERLLEKARSMANQAGDTQSRAEALRAQETLHSAGAAEGRAQLAAVLAQESQYAERRAGIEAEKAEVENQLSQVEQQFRESGEALEKARMAANAAGNVMDGYRLRLEQQTKKHAVAAERSVQLTLEVGSVEHRLHLLREMERDYEGFSRAVKAICRSREGLPGVRGPVASLIRTESRVSLAIEIALGAGLQNIVVEREEDAKAAIRFLQRRDAGRATFLPLTVVWGEELRVSGLEQEAGFVGLASRLVHFAPEYQKIFHSLLGRTVVVEDLDCGIAMARRHRNGFRIVTLDGQVLNRGGSLTGGSVSRTTGVLSRAAEQEELAARVTMLKEKLEASRAEETSAGRKCQESQYQMEIAQGERRSAEDEVLRLEAEKSHLQGMTERLGTQLTQLTEENAQMEERLQNGACRKRDLQAQIEAEEQALLACRSQAEAALSGHQELLRAGTALSEEISDRRSALAALGAQQESARERAQDLSALAEQLSGDRAQQEKRLEAHRREILEAREKAEACRGKAETLAREAGTLRRRLEQLQREKLEIEAERTASSRAGQEANEKLLNLERLVSRLEQKRAAATMEEQQLLNRLWERYELSHSDAQAQRVEVESLSRANRRIGELKRESAQLGTINLGAVEEFDRVNTRYTYLSEQRDDVAAAQRELERIIQKITEEMTGIFTRQFQLLQESFRATFRELFGGGSAALELEDREDPLNCGIEIQAQPPGKSLRTISLLSGGEKAFVAIALYFSILKVHPTPFCVMDEIEAALDDVNVTRCARYLRKMTGHTQFIVITHRRGTMEEADVLYGVTMEEQGISKILTINLNEMEEELKIR